MFYNYLTSIFYHFFESKNSFNKNCKPLNRIFLNIHDLAFRLNVQDFNGLKILLKEQKQFKSSKNLQVKLLSLNQDATSCSS